GSALLAGGMLAFALSFDEIIVTTFTAGHERTLPLWLLNQLSRPRDVPVTNVVAMLVMLVTMFPILGAYYLTRGGESVAGSGGKPYSSALHDEIPAIADVFRFFAGASRCMGGTAGGEYLPGHTSMIRRDPVGVITSIAPWNYPLMMVAWKIAPALAAGNTVVLKPAEFTPLTALCLGEIAHEAGLPAGVLNVLTGDGRTGELIVNHADIDKIAFTGSTEVG